MVGMLAFALLVVGGTYVVTESALLQPARIVLSVRSVWLDVLCHCAKCASFWVGAATTIFGYTLPLAEGAPLLFRSGFAGLCGIAIALIAVNLNLLGNEDETERELILFLRRERTADPDEKDNTENYPN